ncbi:SMI1/KNR4 family protein [Sphingobium yanoikuyae]|uniref:SMI1/KNR4 family protein n=1 Tax=Sphingobium yanoikuyae TaxID=13690 RepID=UPI0028AB5190|nr:SMI1/KNR4 family protein [Sphingobium yanoikuyae]
MTFQFDPSFDAESLHMPGDSLIELDQIESSLRILLPSELRDLFIEFGSAIVFNNDVEFPAEKCAYSDDSGRIGVSVIYGPVDGSLGIIRINEQLSMQIPKTSVAFAEIGLGNMLLIDRIDGKISVWLHDEALPSRAITPVYDSFHDFIDALVAFDPPPLPSLKELGLDLKAMGIEEE